VGKNTWHLGFGRKSKRYNLAAIAAPSQVGHHLVTLRRG
jgi:hypothetical protein